MPTIRFQLHNELAAVAPAGWLGETFADYQKMIAHATFNPTKKMHFLPLRLVPSTISALRSRGFDVDVDKELQGRLDYEAVATKTFTAAADERAAHVDTQLRERGLALYPFQRVGIRWLAERRTALLSDGMGLGKSMQALIAVPEGMGVLVVCPAIAKGVWERETAKWRPDLQVSLLAGRGSFRWPDNGELVVINYDILPAEVPPLPKTDSGFPRTIAVVADEVHYVRGSKSQRATRFRVLAKKAQDAGGIVYLLTGTPMLSTQMDLWNVLRAGGLEREAFDKWPVFVDVMGGFEDWSGHLQWDLPKPESAERLKRVMLRRRKAEVLPDLPRKRYETLVVAIDKKTQAACTKAVQELRKRGFPLVDDLPNDAESLDCLSTLRKLLANAKTPALLQVVHDLEEAKEPVVVFSAHRDPIDFLSKRPGWAPITGAVSAEQRSRTEADFQAGTLKGIAATIQAGGVAITLTYASRVLFLDRSWTPAENEQAEDRVCRIGQTRGVVITTLVADHEIDRLVAKVLLRKQMMIAASVEKASSHG